MKTLMIFLSLFSLPALADYTLVSAPRDTKEKETARYAPIAAELSEYLGVKITYKFIEGWPVYTKEIQENVNDIVFDGPHYVSYRHEYKEHQIVARLAEPLSFLVVVKSDSKLHDLKGLAGRKTCLHAPPNLANTLLQKNYPITPPVTILINGFDNAFKGVVDGSCEAAVVTRGIFKKLNKDNQLKVIHEFPALPNQAITVNNKVPTDIVVKLYNYIVDGRCKSCSVILDTFASKGFTAVNDNDYRGLSNILIDDTRLGKDIQATKVAVK